MTYEIGDNTRNNIKDKFGIIRDLSIQKIFSKNDPINNDDFLENIKINNDENKKNENLSFENLNYDPNDLFMKNKEKQDTNIEFDKNIGNIERENENAKKINVKIYDDLSDSCGKLMKNITLDDINYIINKIDLNEKSFDQKQIKLFVNFIKKKNQLNETKIDKTKIENIKNTNVKMNIENTKTGDTNTKTNDENVKKYNMNTKTNNKNIKMNIQNTKTNNKNIKINIQNTKTNNKNIKINKTCDTNTKTNNVNKINDTSTKTDNKNLIDDLLNSRKQELKKFGKSVKSNFVDSTYFSNDSTNPKILTIKHRISINSTDRNKEKYPNINDFSIELINEETLNITNIQSVQLISTIFPKYSNIDGNLENYPYLILEIKEFGGNYKGTNIHMNKAFSKLVFDRDCGKYKMAKSDNIKYFNPAINITKLSILVKKPNGDKYELGDNINKGDMVIIPEISFDFEFVCIKKHFTISRIVM